MSNLPLNSLQEGEHNLQEMKPKSPAWSSKGYHMYDNLLSNLPLNSLQEGEHILQEMKPKSPAWSSKGYHMYDNLLFSQFPRPD